MSILRPPLQFFFFFGEVLPNLCENQNQNILLQCSSSFFSEKNRQILGGKKKISQILVEHLWLLRI
jgi:hypothetical protein